MLLLKFSAAKNIIFTRNYDDFIIFLRLIFCNYIMWFNRNRRKKCIFVGKNPIKTRPDSLTNQRLPGINVTKIVLFLVTTK